MSRGTMFESRTLRERDTGRWLVIVPKLYGSQEDANEAGWSDLRPHAHEFEPAGDPGELVCRCDAVSCSVTCERCGGRFALHFGAEFTPRGLLCDDCAITKAHQDGEHDDSPDDACPQCREEGRCS